ncbi:MAG: ATP-binding protein [Ruminococcaceae bacterium]|nr:ATP-binding protein [Oscillospiraceae bacterium]
MAMVHLICGMICSGKSHYAGRLREELNGLILSTDEITLSLPQEVIGDCFDRVSDGVNAYLMRKSLDVLATGTDVILDWGFWTAEKRSEIREFYRQHGVEFWFHYIDVDRDTLARNISERNRRVEAGETAAFFVDEGLAEKCRGLFVVPSRDEMDVWVDNRRQGV